MQLTESNQAPNPTLLSVYVNLCISNVDEGKRENYNESSDNTLSNNVYEVFYTIFFKKWNNKTLVY